MAKNIFVIIIVISCLLLYKLFTKSTITNNVNIKIKNENYTLEVAKSLSQKAAGLMNRSSLCPHCGMIFVSSYPSPQIFWMKNTLIPLDIIFLDSQGKIINIEAAPAQAKTADGNYQYFSSSSPAQYVIELNLGDSQKLNLTTGDQIPLPQF
ncbi:MAG: DUF192 domain-containing protein [Microgenomates group bacterium]